MLFLNAIELFNDPIGSYIYMERYVNNGSPSGWHKRSTSPETNPFTGAERFELLEFDDSDIETTIFGDNELLRRSVNYAHPDSLHSSVLSAGNRPICPSQILVSPTSGARTMLIRNGDYSNKGYLKLTYDISRIGRVDRQLTKKHCLACLEASKTLKEAIDNNKIFSRFGIQLETSAKVSVISFEDHIYEWGTVFREYNSYPYKNSNSILIPGFSLFGNDIHSPSGQHLISQFIRKSGISPEEYLVDILLLIVDSYWQVVLSCGFNLELHGQNCLFELNDNYTISRIIARDMDSIDRDIPLQKELGLKSDWKCYPVMCFDENIYYYNIRASYMYDFKLGEYLLSPLINTVCLDFNLKPSIFAEHIKNHVRKEYLSQLPKQYFPEDNCWYMCDNTERQPGQRRKYYANENPKYR